MICQNSLSATTEEIYSKNNNAFANWKRWLVNGGLILAIFLVVTAEEGQNLVSEQKPAPTFSLA